MKISDIPINLRPREKALVYGIEQLSDQELLALLIGSGGVDNSAMDIASTLLKTHGNSMEALSEENYASLTGYLGLKKSKGMRLLATFEFHKRLNSNRYKNMTKIESNYDIYSRYKNMENLDHEELVVLMLNSGRKILKEIVLYKGTFDSFEIDIRQIVQELVLAKAKYFYLIHNHPDEEDKPSEEDILATKIIEKTSSNLGIKLIDHFIIFKGGFVSIKNDQNQINLL